jgi:hypothetical protein
MTREQSWQVTGPTLDLLQRITALGYVVSVHRILTSLLSIVGTVVEMRAVDLRADPPVEQICRMGVDEDDGEP